MSRIESNDVVLTKNSNDTFDINFDAEGDIETKDFLDTSLLRSIYAEKRANANEMPVPEQRRGWIGNATRDFEDGSKVWLYHQAPLNRTTINGVRSEIINGLEWLTIFGVADSFDVEVSIDSNLEMTANITIKRSWSQTENRYYKLFENSGS